MEIKQYVEYDMINHILKNGHILVCNNYKMYTQAEIMTFALCLSHMIKAKGVVTIGWAGPNPQICLNIYD